ncbi:MAG TPA: helix-turn-helix domain-containing protein [Vitreimonas sp.]|nr:helix-turn-helix domain-containing protein [Vitreimonas sp.]
MKNVTQYLEQLGLTPLESQLYLALLESGPTTVLQLSNASKIKRATTHFNVENLIAKGLVSQISQGSRRQIIAEPPEKILLLLDKQKYHLKQLEHQFPEVLSTIHQELPQTKNTQRPVVRYYENLEGFKTATIFSLEHATDEILFITNLLQWHNTYDSKYDREQYIAERLRRNIPLRALVVPQGEYSDHYRSLDKELLRETRYLPVDSDLRTTIFIYNNEVSIMLSNEPFTSIVIESPEIYETFKALFNSLWQKAE